MDFDPPYMNEKNLSDSARWVHTSTLLEFQALRSSYSREILETAERAYGCFNRNGHESQIRSFSSVPP